MNKVLPPLFGALVVPAIMVFLFQWLSYAQSLHTMAWLHWLVFAGAFVAGAACLMMLPSPWLDMIAARIAFLWLYLILYGPFLGVFTLAAYVFFHGI